MSFAYAPPGDVQVNVLTNPRIISLGDATRLVAVIGLGPTTVTITDEAVTRGVTATDNLAAFLLNIASCSVAKVTNVPGVTSGLNNALLSANGALYNLATASIGPTGKLSWPQSAPATLSVDVPPTGSVYYVSYTFASPASQYNPTIFSDKTSLLNMYGAEDTATGILSIAGSIVMENGAPAVMCVQASGSVYSEANYKTAIDKLQKKSNIEQIVCVFPSGSVTRSSQESLLTYAYSHVQLMSANKRERGLLTGSPSTYSASDGFDTIGDASTSGTYLYRANALKNKNVGYIVPSRLRRKDASGNYMELDANYGAAGVGGVQSAQQHRCTPISGFPVVGFEVEAEKWNDFEMNQLGAGNCIVLEGVGGVVLIRDFLTTDPTSADTAEQSVVAQERLVKRSLRDGLDNVYKGKGVVITSQTVIDVSTTLVSILGSLVTQGELRAYGKINDPTTGEQAITTKQDPVEPRRVLCSCSVSYNYPLKWFTINVSTYV